MLSSFFLVCAQLLAPSNNDVSRVEVLVEIEGNCPTDTLRLYAWRGIQTVELNKIAPSKSANGKQVYTLNVNKPTTGVYYLGTKQQDLKMIFLGTERLVHLVAKCDSLQFASIKESKVNQEFQSYLAVLQNRNAQFMEALTEYQSQQSLGNKEGMEKAKKRIKTLDAEKLADLNRLKKVKSPLFRLAALNNYQSWHNNAKANEAEQTYIAEHFFDAVDFTDSLYSYMPFFVENIRNYAATLSRLQLPLDVQEKRFGQLLQAVPKTHPNHSPILLGLALGMLGNNNDFFLKYAKQYLELHSNQSPMLNQFLQEQIQKLRGPLPLGEEAPNIVEKDPEGKERSLRDLRGKVVLIDFWASWCGPCRRENPHVVELYKKYKDKGFEILGVSLDTDRARWVDAIAKDGLTWPQVSDLRGWSSAPGQLYGVSSIPFTVLLDKDGKVIAKQLRGALLTQKLEEIFGQ
jgi:thiol-disulfide isomerase/thioredoxin